MTNALTAVANQSATSLARLKAQWQAEALEAVFLELEPISYRSASIVASKTTELRRRVQEPAE